MHATALSPDRSLWVSSLLDHRLLDALAAAAVYVPQPDAALATELADRLASGERLYLYGPEAFELAVAALTQRWQVPAASVRRDALVGLPAQEG